MTLSVPTLYLVIALNLLAIGIVWACVARRHPKFVAATVWAASCLTGTVGAAISLLRGAVDPLLPVVVGNSLLLMMTWLSWFGLRLFYHRRAPWLVGVVATAATAIMLLVITVGDDDSQRTRIVLYSLAQSIPVALMVIELLSHRDKRHSGDDLAIGALSVMIVLHAARALASLTNFGGEVTLREFNSVQATILVLLIFVAIVGNFAFLLMTFDRLREEVATLALSDDLTGVANRRRLLQRLADECALSRRTHEPFAIMVMDLDAFKPINDTYGHAAGDECLRAFCRLVQSRLRSSDLLARIGGDEFCVVLPRTTAHEAGKIACDLIAIYSHARISWQGVTITLTASVGIAQWSAVNDTPERMMAAADHALYEAKRDGKDRLALHEGATGTVPPAPMIAQLRSA